MADKTTTPTTDAVETETPKAPKERKGVQLSTIVHEESVVKDLDLLRHALRLENPSAVVRQALTEFVDNHQEDARKYREFFGITD